MGQLQVYIYFAPARLPTWPSTYQGYCTVRRRDSVMSREGSSMRKYCPTAFVTCPRWRSHTSPCTALHSDICSCLSVAFARLLVAMATAVSFTCPVPIRLSRNASRHRFVSCGHTANDHLEAAQTTLHRKRPSGSGDRPNAATASGRRGCVGLAPH